MSREGDRRRAAELAPEYQARLDALYKRQERLVVEGGVDFEAEMLWVRKFARMAKDDSVSPEDLLATMEQHIADLERDLPGKN